MTHIARRPVALIILDGWGVATSDEGGAIAAAHTPCYDEICSRYPAAALSASGAAVGLPDGEPADAEVGHRTIGAGRIVQTETARIQKAVAAGGIESSKTLQDAFFRASVVGSSVHLVGLLSDAGKHSTLDSLYSMLRAAKAAGHRDVFVHGILDGLDVSPRTADVYVEALEIKMADIGVGRIASLCGRFYAMDTGENWERTARTFTMLVHGEGERTLDAVTAIRASFLRGISDEFIAPIVIEREASVPAATVKGGDLVIFFNHDPAPMRQLVRFLSLPGRNAAKPVVETVCIVEYDPSFGLPVVFEPVHESNDLPGVLERNGVLTSGVSESSRQPHLSALLNGRPGEAAGGEQNIFLDSPGPEHLESVPESMSFKIADRVLRQMESATAELYIVNFPAPAVVAAAGNFDSTVEAVQHVDTCLGGVIERIVELNGIAVVTSSHGPLSTPAGGGASVPFLFVDPQTPDARLAPTGTLQDVAPTLLGLLGIESPAEMTGRDLRLAA